MPWRATRDPWAILVSEVMLQQTQAERVIPKWLSFMERWPTVQACSAASLGDVLRVWQGLGYPRRARNLHETATILSSQEGVFPDTLPGLLALPGVGAYTARAILAFAFERDAAVVDTNVARVLARMSGMRLTSSDVQRLADELVPSGHGWVWNQLMLDLGATVCTARSPGCSRCPVAGGCAWRSGGSLQSDPAVGSAGVSGPQARFEGSDRQARGRLLRRLAAGPVERSAAQAILAMSDVRRAERIVVGLLQDRLITARAGQLALPE